VRRLAAAEGNGFERRAARILKLLGAVSSFFLFVFIYLLISRLFL
jgi:hypothetical protein